MCEKTEDLRDYALYKGKKYYIGDTIGIRFPVNKYGLKLTFIYPMILESMDQIEELRNKGIEIYYISKARARINNLWLNNAKKRVSYERVDCLQKEEIQSTNSKLKQRDNRSTPLIKQILDYIPNDLNFYIKKDTSTVAFLTQHNPLELFRLYATRIAFTLDKQYKENIRDCDHLFLINDLDGTPFQINKDVIDKNIWINIINHQACFRRKEDLIVCQILLKDLKKRIWTGKPTHKDWSY